MEKIVVIGGGASGFFAAINVAKDSPKSKVIILEKTNKLLSKVKVSGGGRCNVTHSEFDPFELSKNYPRGEKELIGPFNHFAAGDIISWFDERGIELKVEKDGRMFPASNSSQTIIDCFLSEAKKYQVEIKNSSEVIRIAKETTFVLSMKDGTTIDCNKLIVGAGGNSKSNHYNILSELKHNIIPPIPSLFTFNLRKHESNELMGLSQEVSVRLEDKNYLEEGPLLFTHWGMSGPAILKLSSKAASYLFKKNYQFNFYVSWIDGAKELIEYKRKSNGNNKVSKSKLEEMSNRLWLYLVKRAGISEQKNWADLNKKEISSFSEVLENDKYFANGKTTFKEEFVTCGGVDLKEINLKTMESKLVTDLFFCGEIMNIDAVTGGFNFQSAWTTAFLAAKAISDKG